MTGAFPVATFLPALLFGLAGSLHCAGMCGGFAVLAGGAGARGRGRRRFLVAQTLYHAGKTSSYVFLGALVGLGGEVVARAGAGWHRALAVAAGVVLLTAGLRALGWLPSPTVTSRTGSPKGGSRMGQLLTRATGGVARLGRQVVAVRAPWSPLLLGALSGFLPCPLVYAFLAAAAASASVASAISTMAALGLSTIPVLMLVAVLGRAIPLGLRVPLVRLTGVLLVGLAVYTWIRGWSAEPFCCGA